MLRKLAVISLLLFALSPSSTLSTVYEPEPSSLTESVKKAKGWHASLWQRPTIALTKKKDNSEGDEKEEGRSFGSSISETDTFLQYNDSQLSIFYIKTPSSKFSQVRQKRIRVVNVKEMEKKDPNIKHFMGIYWRSWEEIRVLYKSFRIPTVHMPKFNGKRNRRGKYARWASLLLASAYQIQFRIPHLVILEDDVRWSRNLGHQLMPHLRNDSRVVRLSTWGEGFLFSLSSAINYVSQVYEKGINSSSDIWIRDVLYPPSVSLSSIPYELLVKSSQGNIWSTDMVENSVDFDYSPFYNDPSPLFDRVGLCYFPSKASYLLTEVSHEHALFKSRSDLNFTKVASRLNGSLSLRLCP